MCGIYTIGTSPGKQTGSPEQDFRNALAAVLAFAPPAGAGAVRPAMEALNDASLRFLRLAPQLAIVRDAALRTILSAAAAQLRAWTARVEACVETAALPQHDAEDLNYLLTCARDVAWRIANDVLPNAGKILGLLGDAPSEEDALAHAWHLNLICNNLDRLEVRGRDSAGIAAYVYFPSADARAAFLARPAVADRLPALDPGAVFAAGSVTVPAASPEALLFAFKVADEVGEMGENVRRLRAQIAEHDVFQHALRAPGARLCALAHTRWASNGIISVPNCHPVDGAALVRGALDPGSRGDCIAALNGDIDNYQELTAELRAAGVDIHPDITTDAKIIPLMIAHLRRGGLSAHDAFNAMVDRAAGSMAIAALFADRPGEMFLAQKGSGQGLFLGLADESVAAASEMYGIVELTDRYLKAEGELEKNDRPAGERFHVDLAGPTIAAARPEGTAAPAKERIRRAEITTRDIDRGAFPRYLLKEITESVASVRKTLRGKLRQAAEARCIHLGDDAVRPECIAALKSGAIRRIVTTGQGTAAVAGQGIAYLLNRVLGGTGIAAEAMKATELSGHHLRADMRDTLVIAVSQSGTTTDTNRTVDLVKARGAHVIGIVNRRNSDLVYKSHSVLYTSDGRDIEMSVASTKAFYAQNVAGQILALALAERLGALPPETLARELEALEEFPAAMAATLATSDAVRDLAYAHAPRHRHWAIVGTGPGRIAADEIRIKLSELCYKAIAVDFLEDKKHIDLSSEPLVLVCAAGLSAQQVGDAVKEVAIFKAHKSVPIVITDEGETRFTPYAAGQIRVPRHAGGLAYLLPVMVGHLFAFHAAEAFERAARELRQLRSRITAADSAAEPPVLGEDAEFVAEAMQAQRQLLDGVLNSGLEPSTAIRLNEALDFALCRMDLDLLPLKFQCAGTRKNLQRVTCDMLSAAINELTRPIDAIKHQAKTVTVGISRLEEVAREGAIWRCIEALELPAGMVPASIAEFLTSFSPLVGSIDGATAYHLTDLTPLGRPRYATSMRAVRKIGAAEGIPSRYDRGKALLGTKRRVVQERTPYLGLGQKDGRTILIVPFVADREEGELLLMHFTLAQASDPAVRLNALRRAGGRYDAIVALVTEHDVPWSDDLLAPLDNRTLFLTEPSEAAAAAVSAYRARAGAGYKD